MSFPSPGLNVYLKSVARGTDKMKNDLFERTKADMWCGCWSFCQGGFFERVIVAVCNGLNEVN